MTVQYAPSNLQPQPEAGRVYYQLFARMTDATFGPATTAAILTTLAANRTLVWVGLTEKGRPAEYVVYVQNEAELVEVKFPVSSAVHDGWLHVSCADQSVTSAVFDEVMAAITKTTKALEDEASF